jgi:hypothetical protein
MKKGASLKEKTFSRNKNGQVWVETVVYLLIAFVMMGLVLSFIKPKIEEMRDRTIIEQSLGIIKEIDNSITTIGSPGNKRLIEVGIRKGSIIINSTNDVITFTMDGKYAYTEPGTSVQLGNVLATTEDIGAGNSRVTLKRDFNDGYDLTYNGQQIEKTLTKASNPYRLFISNEGEIAEEVIIDFDVE